MQKSPHFQHWPHDIITITFYETTIWSHNLQYTSNCNFPLWKFRELRVKVVSILDIFDIMSAVDNATNQPRPSRELAYWLAHKEQFPILFHLATVSAASSKCECVFYAAGHTVTPKRANLNPDKLEECAIVRCNLRLLKSMGLRHWEEITASVLVHFPQ